MLPFGQLWNTQVSDAVDYAKFYSPSYDAGNVIETHEPTGDFKAWWSEAKRKAPTAERNQDASEAKSRSDQGAQTDEPAFAKPPSSKNYGKPGAAAGRCRL